MPKRRRKLLGAALLRLDKMYIALLRLLLILAGLFIAAFMQEKMGNFTINLNRLELFRKGIAIADDGEFTAPTARLKADSVDDATNISFSDIPSNIATSYEGNHNGENYMAYTYYIRNAGKEDLSYRAYITLESYSKGADEAVRVAVWKNGKRTIYAKVSADGTPEPGCTNFQSDSLVCTYEENEFLVGNVDKYTVVIWLEGDDPECIDRIVGGSVEFSMRIDSDDDDNTSHLYKYVKDIVDMLTGNKPIFAAGNEAPGYYNPGEVTWANRRNQDNFNAETDVFETVEEAEETSREETQQTENTEEIISE